MEKLLAYYEERLAREQEQEKDREGSWYTPYEDIVKTLSQVHDALSYDQACLHFARMATQVVNMNTNFFCLALARLVMAYHGDTIYP